MPVNNDIPSNQRALILQGGGAFGAYEAGAYSVLYESLSKRIRDNENIFDIIAGTSIGAMNAAIIVSHVIENRRQHVWNWLNLFVLYLYVDMYRMRFMMLLSIDGG